METVSKVLGMCLPGLASPDGSLQLRLPGLTLTEDGVLAQVEVLQDHLQERDRGMMES